MLPEEIDSLKKQIDNLESIKQTKNFINKTIHADLIDTLPLIPDEFADLIIIDPPYNLTKNFNGMKFNAMKEDSYEEYLDSWLPEVCKKLKPNGSLYLCGDWKCTSALQRALEKNLTVINRITWQREKGRGAKENWKNGMEDIWYAVKNPKDYYFDVESVKMKRKVIAPYKVDGKPKDWDEGDDGNFRITYPSNFWDDISIPFWSMPENTDHPTQKPEKLYAKLVLASSKPGDVVFDPFLGSGTASVVAKKLGRKFCGIEMNEEYCMYAAKRLLRAEEDKEIQGYKDNVFWERNSLNAQQKSEKKVLKKCKSSMDADLFTSGSLFA
ncbi:MAG: site-specific DNA-methyltransferase [Treponema sp.]|nr:site-specific DNA-methyltransferase [Clostridia bacterium]MCF0242522.1 site-specific DNA-methyltransferase [Treponema sp.]